MEYEQLKVPGYEEIKKKVYRFVVYYYSKWADELDIEVSPNEDRNKELKQAWAIFYKKYPKIHVKGYHVTDIFEVI